MLTFILVIIALWAGLLVGGVVGFLLARTNPKVEPVNPALATSLRLTAAAWEAERAMWNATLGKRRPGQ